LLYAFEAVWAGAAGVYEAAHTGQVTYAEIFDMVTDFGHAAYDLMARYHRVSGAAPFIARLMDV
jgi:hypothetical protein